MDGSSRPRYPDASLWSVRRRQADPLGFLESLAREGDFVPFTLARRQAFLLNRPDYVSTVLASHAAAFQKGSANQRAKRLLGNGLLTADAAPHSDRRKAIQPAFARSRLEACVPMIVARARGMRDRWIPDEVVDVTQAMGELTFGIVGETIVGASVDSLFEEVRQAVSDATASVDPLVSLVAPLRAVRIAQARLRRVAESLLTGAAGPAPEGSLLSLLRLDETARESAAGQRIDDLLTMLLAGHDTMTSALTWAWLLLSSRPDVEQALQVELASVLDGRDASAAHVPSLVYTRAILAEALRLYPPAWVLARHAIEPHRFDEGEIPAGAIVLVSQYLLHRDERWFDRPRVFDPDRWVQDRQPDRPRSAYFPFGAGPRSCIGESFAWMEGVLLLATIAQRWKLTPVSPFPTMDLRITLRPRQRVLLRAAVI
ncbi:MAG: cytochrome P450 [Acidobacteria bacterium]|nr:cytochrome P450 [Acidobacteriota bacterium]